MTTKRDLGRYRANLQEEVDSTAVYAAMASNESEPRFAKVYEDLGQVEEKHAQFWERQLQQAGAAVRRPGPSWRARILIWYAKHWGAAAVLPRVASMEVAHQDEYAAQAETVGTGMTGEERQHARVLRSLLEGKPTEGGALGTWRVEGRKRALGGNALRAAVMGANDGLCSNLSLIMGVAGAKLGTHGVLLTGFAGLLAGAGSMALGEWVSVQTSRELAQRQIRTKREELEINPDEERDEIRLIYEAKGVTAAAAEDLARRLIASPGQALDVLTREALGIDPRELGGSPWIAAISSMLLFSIGAFVPVAPFLFRSGNAAVITSLCASGIALFLFGAAISAVTRRSFLFSGLRQLAFGVGAAGLIFAVGRLIGAAVGG